MYKAARLRLRPVGGILPPGWFDLAGEFDRRPAFVSAPSCRSFLIAEEGGRFYGESEGVDSWYLD